MLGCKHPLDETLKDEPLAKRMLMAVLEDGRKGILASEIQEILQGTVQFGTRALGSSLLPCMVEFAHEDGFVLRTKEPVLIVVVVDCSGSMQGARIQEAQRAVKYLLELCRKTGRVEAGVIAFNRSARVLLSPSEELTEERILQVEKELVAAGGTQFLPALEAMMGVVNGALDKGQSVVATLFTDGEDASALREDMVGYEVQGRKTALLEALRTREGFMLHTVGIGKNVHEQFLRRLATWARMAGESVLLEEDGSSGMPGVMGALFATSVETILQPAYVEVTRADGSELMPALPVTLQVGDPMVKASAAFFVPADEVFTLRLRLKDKTLWEETVDCIRGAYAVNGKCTELALQLMVPLITRTCVTKMQEGDYEEALLAVTEGLERLAMGRGDVPEEVVQTIQEKLLKVQCDIQQMELCVQQDSMADTLSQMQSDAALGFRSHSGAPALVHTSGRQMSLTARTLSSID